MKVRRQQGGTLGLVAACVFLVIIVGVGFYFLSKIIGGGREVANATDAGALNVAKHAIRRGAVALTLNGNDSAEFGGLVDPDSTPNSIDLLTYNRMVAQAIIVAKNAEAEGTAAAHANAATVMNRVKAYGTELRKNLDTNAYTTLGSDFSNLANQNNTKMWNGNQATLPDAAALKAGYMKDGASTNVWIPASIKAGWSSAIPSLETTQSATSGDKYIAGYKKFQVNLGASGTQEIYGVPVLPQSKTHLADNAKFTTTNFDGAGATPPNAWQTKSQAIEAKSGAIGGAVSCAIVGVIDKDFQASIPRGFVRVLNNASAEQVNGQPAGGAVPVSDGENDIFNNELFVPTHPGVYQSNNGVVTSNNSAGLSAWAAYNATTTGQAGHTDVTWEDTTLYPDSAAHGGGDPAIWSANNLANYLTPGDHGLYYHYSAAPAHHEPAQEAELRGITSTPVYCNHTYYDENVAVNHPSCANLANMSKWEDIFDRHTTAPGGGHQAPDGYTNVEFMKSDLLGKIAGRLGGDFCANVGGPANPSGVKAWKDKNGNPALGKKAPYAPGHGGFNKINYLVTGSPAELINQMPNCAGMNIYASITDRLKQVDNTISQADVTAAMGSKKLDLGVNNWALTRTTGGPTNGRLYVYVESGTVKMANALPGGWGDLANTADGQADNAGGSKHCTLSSPTNGWAVNTEKGGGYPTGDGGYHEVPFTEVTGNPSFTDHAYWQESSGSGNLLGELRFEQEVTGARFCKPN